MHRGKEALEPESVSNFEEINKRVKENYPEVTDNLILEIATNYAAPVLNSYCHWLLREAERMGIKRLYFLARDGEILYKIAQIFDKKNNLSLDLRYLLASRQSWILPSIKNFSDIADYEVFFRFAKGLTLRRLLHRFKIEHLIGTELLNRKLEQYDQQLDEPISVFSLASARKFISDQEIVAEIIKQAEREFTFISRYFAREGLLEGKKYGIVDIGWRGSLAQALRNLLDKNGLTAQTIHFFFFDLFSTPQCGENDAVHAFLKENDMRPDGLLHGEMEILMEIFTATPSPSLQGFEQKNGEIAPIFMSEDMKTMKNWGIELFQTILLNYSEQIAGEYRNAKFNWQQFYRYALDNFYEFLKKPDEKYVRKINEFPYLVKQIYLEGDEFNSICKKYRLKDFWKIIKNANPYLPDDLWIQGSLTLTNNFFVRNFFKLFYKMMSFTPVRRIEKRIRSLT